ncbi:hypothetical protein Gotur_026813, partial [Gossypium turneri]
MANELKVEDGEYSEPVSPTAQYLNSSVVYRIKLYFN